MFSYLLYGAYENLVVSSVGLKRGSKKWQCTSSCNTRLQMTSSKGNVLQHILLSKSINIKWSRLRLKCDGTHAKIRFCLSAKRTSPFKSAGASVQSITGSRGVRISGRNAGHTMFRGNVKGTGYPLHSQVSPLLPLPCVTVCHQHFNWTLPFSTSWKWCCVSPWWNNLLRKVYQRPTKTP